MNGRTKCGAASMVSILSVCLSLMAEAEGQHGCPKDWYQLYDTCIHVVDDISTWQEAQTRCNSLKSDLLVSKGTHEDTDLESYLQGYYYWTALKEDRDCNPAWTEKFQNRQSRYHPSEQAGSCSSLRCFHYRTGEGWTSDDCRQRRRFICQRARYTATNNSDGVDGGNKGVNESNEDDESEETTIIVVVVLAVIVGVIVIILTAVFVYRLHRQRRNRNDHNKNEEQTDLDVYAVISNEEDRTYMNADVSAAPLLTPTSEEVTGHQFGAEPTPADTYSKVNKNRQPQDDGRTVTPEGLVYLTVAQTGSIRRSNDKASSVTEATPASQEREYEPTQYVTVDLEKTSQRLASDDDQVEFSEE